MLESEEGTELREAEERPGKSDDSALEKSIQAALTKIRGHAEPLVTPSCCFCEQVLSGEPVFLSVSREITARHVQEEHPDIRPRSREEVIRAYQAAEKRKRAAVDAEIRRLREASRRGSRRKPGPKRRKDRNSERKTQPELTGEMIEEALRLYPEVRSILKIAEMRYEEWGFGSPWTLRLRLYPEFHGRGVRLVKSRPGSGRHSFLTDAMLEKARHLCEEGGKSIPQIAALLCEEFGYSQNGLRNALYRVFRERGVNYLT